MVIASISTSIISFLLWLDGIIYNLVRYSYRIFNYLATLNLFDESDYHAIVERIYIILGVVMLFILAYSLLKAIIDPDTFSKGDYSVPTMIKNVVISLVIIAVLPTVFTLAFNIQNAIFNYDVIGKLILVPNSTIDANDDGIGSGDGGATIAYYAFQSFFHPNVEHCKSINSVDGLEKCSESITAKGGWFNEKNFGTLNEANDLVKSGGSFTYYANFSNEVDKGDIDYSVIVSTVVGILLVLVLLSYCVDLGIRVIKLIFYQMIAPIPVICRVLPSQKKVFDEWAKKTISTFLEAFIRIAIMYLGIYLINLIIAKMADIVTFNINSNDIDIVQLLMIRVFLIVGVILFMKQAPKLLKDLFPSLDLGGANPLGRMLGMGAAIGSGYVTGIRNFNKTRKNGDDWKTFGKALTSGAAGFGSGAARGGWAARNAKNLKDMKSAASTGIKGAEAAKVKRETYRAAHGDNLGGVISGHISDFERARSSFWGITGGSEALAAEIKAITDVDNAMSSVTDAAKELLKKDAAKGKAKTYGISSTTTFDDSGLSGNWGGQYSAFGTHVYNDIQSKVKEAQIKGAAVDKSGRSHSLDEWEKLLGAYEADFAKQVANQASVGVTKYQKYSADLRADLAAVRIESENMKTTFVENASLETIQKSGVGIGDFSAESDFDFFDARIKDDLSNNIKIDKADLQTEYNKLRKQETEGKN